MLHSIVIILQLIAGAMLFSFAATLAALATKQSKVRSSIKEYLSALASGLFLLLATSAPAQTAGLGKAIPSAGLPAGAPALHRQRGDDRRRRHRQTSAR